MSAILINLEAEESILGYFFNPYEDENEKRKLLMLVTIDHFSRELYQKIYHFIKMFKLFDKLLIYNKMSELKHSVDWLDFEAIDEVTTKEDAQQYFKILEDKMVKRSIYGVLNQSLNSLVSGEDQYEVAMETAQRLSTINPAFKLRSTLEILDSALNNTRTNVINWGYENLTLITGGATRGNVNTIGGDSGHLKTTIAIDMAFRMLDSNPNIRIGVFSKEMLSEELMNKIICRQCKLTMKDVLTGNFNKVEIRKIISEYPPIRDGRLVLIDPSEFSHASDITKIQFSYGFDVWFLDFIQLLDYKGNNDASAFNISVMENAKTLKSLSTVTNSVGMVLSQLKKGVDERKSKIPNVSDLEWSGAIKQLSAYIFMSYYPYKYYKHTTVSALKPHLLTDKVPNNLYYLLALKTRFAGDVPMPFKIEPEYGRFKEIIDLQERTRYENVLSLL